MLTPKDLGVVVEQTVFVAIDTCQSNFDTTLRVFKGIGNKLDEIAQNDDSQFCDAFSLAAIEGVALPSGSTYYIAVVGQLTP